MQCAGQLPKKMSRGYVERFDITCDPISLQLEKTGPSVDKLLLLDALYVIRNVWE